MEAWAWVLVVVALVLLVAGTLRFDLLWPAVRERLGGRDEGDDKAARERGSPTATAATHGHGAAGHTGPVAPHGAVRFRGASGTRAGKRH
jgi:hypothetical protein